MSFLNRYLCIFVNHNKICLCSLYFYYLLVWLCWSSPFFFFFFVMPSKQFYSMINVSIELHINWETLLWTSILRINWFYSQIGPAVVPGFGFPVFWTHNDCKLKGCGEHHMCYHAKKTCQTTTQATCSSVQGDHTTRVQCCSLFSVQEKNSTLTMSNEDLIKESQVSFSSTISNLITEHKPWNPCIFTADRRFSWCKASFLCTSCLNSLFNYVRLDELESAVLLCTDEVNKIHICSCAALSVLQQ